MSYEQRAKSHSSWLTVQSLFKNLFLILIISESSRAEFKFVKIFSFYGVSVSDIQREGLQDKPLQVIPSIIRVLFYDVNKHIVIAMSFDLLADIRALGVPSAIVGEMMESGEKEIYV